MGKPLQQEVIDKVRELLTTTTKSHAAIGDEIGISHEKVRRIKNKYQIERPIDKITGRDTVPIDPTNEKILQLERHIIALRDERNACKKAYEAVQRKNGVFQALVEELRETVKPISPLPPAPKIQYSGKRIQESLVLCLSDEHATDEILPHQVGGLEHYDFNIALRRAETLVDSTIKFTQKTLKGYEFKTLYILSLGDHVSGEIHNAVDNTTYRNIFKNCLATGQMQALMIRDLAPHFENVKVICVSGNHGRKSVKKDYQGPKDNWDYLVSEIAYAYCRDLINVEFLIPDSWSANINIEDHGFHICHGDDVRSWNSIPFYGIERKTRRLAALNNAIDRKVFNFVFGHFHTIAAQDVLKGEVLINGSWVATSPYVYNALSTFNEPAQVLFGVHKEFGMTWRLHVKLRSDDEEQGPKRYSVIMAK